MKPATKQKSQSGFTMVELMVSVAIFVVISTAIFSLLGNSQKQFRTESQLLGTFQEARIGLDQIVRDAGDAGYPPQNHFAVLPAANLFAIGPIGWHARLCCRSSLSDWHGRWRDVHDSWRL